MDDQHDPQLDPRTEERVRRLLAEARHADPMPADVVARLDGVIADLAAEPAAQVKVVRLADRRRKALALLAAAAVVVIGGVGIGQALQGSGGGAASTAGGTERNSPARAPAPADQNAGAATPAQGKAHVDTKRGAVALRIRPQHFSQDVSELASQPKAARAAQAFSASMDSLSFDDGTDLSPCPHRKAWGSGRFVAVTYGRVPGYLVFRKPAGDTQVVDLFLCGAATAVRSTTLPRP